MGAHARTPPRAPPSWMPGTTTAAACAGAAAPPCEQQPSAWTASAQPRHRESQYGLQSVVRHVAALPSRRSSQKSSAFKSPARCTRLQPHRTIAPLKRVLNSAFSICRARDQTQQDKVITLRCRRGSYQKPTASACIASFHLTEPARRLAARLISVSPQHGAPGSQQSTRTTPARQGGHDAFLPGKVPGRSLLQRSR